MVPFDRKHYGFNDIHVLLAHLKALIVKQNKLSRVVRKQAFCMCGNKAEDHLRSGPAPLFSLHRSYNPSAPYIRNFKPLATHCGCRSRFVSDPVGSPED